LLCEHVNTVNTVNTVIRKDII